MVLNKYTVCVPNSEVQKVLGTGRFQIFDGADPVQTLLKEELG